MACAGGLAMIAKIDLVWRWWCAEMLLLLPLAWRQWGDQWVALWRPDGTMFFRRRGSQAEVATPPPGAALILRLPDQRIWRRQIVLPRNAARFLHQILHNEMERRTPWRADQVYFDAAVPPEQNLPDQMAVTLSLLPRERVAAALADLSSQGWTVDRIELLDGADAALSGPQVAIEDGRRIGAQGPVWPGRLVAALLCAALLSIAGQLVLQAVTAEQLASVREQSASIRHLASDIAAMKRRQHYPALRREESQTAIAILDRLARALPDDAWAEQIELAPDGITVGGVAGEPARLLASLQAQGFTDAQFRAPITPAEKGGQKFLLHAHLPEAHLAQN
jgi:general secretion pathway protein L